MFRLTTIILLLVISSSVAKKKSPEVSLSEDEAFWERQLLDLGSAPAPPTPAPPPKVPELVANISVSSEFGEFNGWLYFAGNDGSSGDELWRTNGYETTLHKDINPGAASSSPSGFIVYEGNLYFSAYEESTGRELWRTNDAETTLVKDILPGGDDTPGSGSSDPGGFTEFKNWLYFTTMTRLPGFRAPIVDELWRTNGSVTEQVAFLDSSLDALPYDLANFDGNLYFSAFESSTGKEVWRTDGLDVPYLFADIYPGDSSSEPPPYRQFTEFNSYLYFAADDGTTGVELWRTDGYETELVEDINKVQGFNGGTDPSLPEELTVFEGYLYFRATDDRIYQLWRTDGNETIQVTDINADTFGPSFFPSDLKEAGGSLYFTANDGVNGREIWKTDGYETAQVADIYPGEGWSDPRFYHDFAGYVYFQADDGSTGVELWRTDGIETTLVADLNPGSESSYPGGSNSPGGFYGFNSFLYFGANLGLWRLSA